jgi:hypothetical protein
MTMRRLKSLLVVVLALGNSACSHKPLKAPCDLNEGKPSAAMDMLMAAVLPESLVSLMVNVGPCGPLRRLGRD